MNTFELVKWHAEKWWKGNEVTELVNWQMERINAEKLWNYNENKKKASKKKKKTK